MDARRLNDLMHAVLDGEASPEERAELAQWLAHDEPARREFDSLQALFRTMAAQPAFEPPEGLSERIAAALPSRSARTPEISIQLSERPRVIASRPERTRGLASRVSTIVRWLFPADPTTESWNMNTNRKIWVGGAVAAAAVGIAVFVFDYPPKSQDVLGTVVPAERYRAPQAGAEAVKLGTPAAGTSAGTDTLASFDAERVRAEIKASEARIAELKVAEKAAEADRTRAERVRAELASAERYLAELRMLDQRAAEIKAAEAKVADLKSAEKVEADRTRVERVRAELTSAELKLADLRAMQMKSADRVRAERAVMADLKQADLKAQRTEADLKVQRTQADLKAERTSSDK